MTKLPGFLLQPIRRQCKTSDFSVDRGQVRRPLGADPGHAILTNLRYTGRRLRNKQPKSEQVIDVSDVALGHTTKQTRNEPGWRIWAAERVHEPLIDADISEQAQVPHQAKGAADERGPHRSPRGIMRCGICGRKNAGHLEQRQTQPPASLPVVRRIARLSSSALAPGPEECLHPHAAVIVTVGHRGGLLD
jgi:hypothetical protein